MEVKKAEEIFSVGNVTNGWVNLEWEREGGNAPFFTLHFNSLTDDKFSRSRKNVGWMKNVGR